MSALRDFAFNERPNFTQPRFAPLRMFRGGAQGAWFDPSDLSTLFQDSLGLTAVTAAGDPVGLMLDKSQGLGLGPELATNGGFDTDTAWAKEGWVIASGVATKTPGIAGGLYQASPSMVEGDFVKLVFTLSGVTAGTVTPFVRGTNVGIGYTTNGTWTAYAKAGTESARAVNFYADPAFDGSIDNISARKLPGSHATQTTAAARPTYQTSGGLHWLAFDGVDDFLVTSTITPGTDKVQVFAGVRKLLDAATGMLVENSTGAGSFSVAAPNGSAAANYFFASRGSIEANATASPYSAPRTSVLTAAGDISGDSAILRVNGVQKAASATDQGTGNYGNSPLYIGSRAGTSLHFIGNLFGLILRWGASSAADVGHAERYLARKSGVVL